MTIEERIAELEAKIAAMTSVQEPTEYYMSKYSGEEADSLLDKVKNGEAGGGSAGVRPNLLDNWYFAGNGVAPGFPVNQRGGSTWNTSGAFTFDRWRNGRAGSVITLSGSYVTLNGLGDLFQFQPGQELLGKTVCLSVLTTDGLFYGARELPTETPLENDIQVVFSNTRLILLVGMTTQGYAQVSIMSGNSAENHVIAAKLELGETQTLARKTESGWELLEIPDYGVELAKCQRYYIKVGDNLGALAYGVGIANLSIAVATIPTPVTMRTKPVIADIVNNGIMYYNNSKVQVTGWTVDSAHAGGVRLFWKSGIAQDYACNFEQMKFGLSADL